MKKRYPKILPKRVGSAPGSQNKSTVEGEPLTKLRLPPKRACNVCRMRKTACDGRQPRCGTCLKKGLECVYSSRHSDATQSAAIHLQKRLNEYEEFVYKLRFLPEEDAMALVRNLRSTSSPYRHIHQLNGAMDGMQRPSDNSTARAILPPTGSELEFELMARHQLAYSVLMPLNLTSMPLSPVGGAILSNQASSYIENRSLAKHSRILKTSGHKITPDVSGAYIENDAAMVQRPPASTFCDCRLHKLQINVWTNVPINNNYAAAILSLFLQTNHAILGQFDADLFLTDLVGKRARFCSPFLISSLMYLACQQYTTVDINASALKLLFLSEAESHWRRESSSVNLLNIASIMTLSIGCAFHGRDAFGLELARAGRAMAENLGLFGIGPDENAENMAAFHQMPPEWKRAASHIAWGAYNWLGMHGIFFPDDPIEHPPALPLPVESSEGMGNLQSVLHLAPYIGPTFLSFCRLWTIAQEVAVCYSGHKTSSDVLKSGRDIEVKYQKLLLLADSLPMSMLRTTNSPIHVTVFHMCYHCVILRTFRPVLSASKSQVADQLSTLPSFYSHDSSPDCIFNASLNQLKQLILDYYLLYPPEFRSIVFNIALLQVADASIANFTREYWCRFFLFCVRCWQDLYISYPVFAEILQAYLSMALRDGVLTTRDAQNLLTEMREKGGHHDNSSKPITTIFADFGLALTQPSEAQAHTLAERFDELGLFVDVTKGEYAPL